jgi:hypothetical protein
VVGFDFVEAEQQARVQAVLHGTDVTLDLLAAENHVAVGGNEIFVQLNFEVLARMQFGGVELVLKPDEEGRAFRDSVRRSHGRDGRIDCLGQQ